MQPRPINANTKEYQCRDCHYKKRYGKEPTVIQHRIEKHPHLSPYDYREVNKK